MPLVRLQKAIADAGVCSRRRAEILIAAGHVAVNGEVVTAMGTQVDPAVDDITLDGRPLVERPGLAAELEYWALNKPRGVVSTAADPQGRPTALSLVPTDTRVFPVGRLDADSSGLLLLTNDGDLALRLTHPRYGHEKEYRALVRGVPGPTVLDRLRNGVLIDGRTTLPAEVEVLERIRVAAGEATWLRIVLREGRQRQIRRMMQAVGHPVRQLERVRVGPIRLGRLGEGDCRRLTEAEIRELTDLTEPADDQAASDPGTMATSDDTHGADAGRGTTDSSAVDAPSGSAARRERTGTPRPRRNPDAGGPQTRGGRGAAWGHRPARTGGQHTPRPGGRGR